MSITSADAVERSTHKTNRWLKELMAELGLEDREEAWRLLRAYLQLLRERLTVDEAAQLAAQLPLVLRGAFYEGFDPSRQPIRLRDRNEFLARMIEHAQPIDPTTAERAVQAATTVLRRHVSEGEVEQALSQLPNELREVLVPS
jgi:uncharacterized protein (DUF2267 family)